jgi:hypothetical protein
MKHHLSLLSVLHYVFGALQCLGGLAVLVVVFVGGFLKSDWLSAQADEPVPSWIGGLLQTVGWVLFVLVEAWGVLNLYSAHAISMRRNRTLSMVTAALNCLTIPFGLALGIYTFITLSDREVREAYGLPA